jgi:hypothetical protein
MKYFLSSLLFLTLIGGAKKGLFTKSTTSPAVATGINTSFSAPTLLKQQYFEEGIALWRVTFAKNLEELKAAYSTASINTSNFRRFLEKTTFSMPIKKQLRKEWVALLRELRSSVTGAVLFSKMMNQNLDYWKLLNNPQKVTAHYRTHRRYYSRLDMDEDDLAEKELPQKAFFVAALRASMAPQAFNAIQEQLRRAAALQKRAQTYQTLLDQWFAGEIRQINLMYLGQYKPPVSCDCLESTAAHVTYANISKKGKEKLLTTIKAGCEEKSNPNQEVGWKEAMRQTRSALHAYRASLLKQQEWQTRSLKDIEEIKFPTNVGLWVQHCDSISISRR